MSRCAIDSCYETHKIELKEKRYEKKNKPHNN